MIKSNRLVDVSHCRFYMNCVKCQCDNWHFPKRNELTFGQIEISHGTAQNDCAEIYRKVNTSSFIITLLIEAKRLSLSKHINQAKANQKPSKVVRQQIVAQLSSIAWQLTQRFDCSGCGCVCVCVWSFFLFSLFYKWRNIYESRRAIICCEVL